MYSLIYFSVNDTETKKGRGTGRQKKVDAKGGKRSDAAEQGNGDVPFEVRNEHSIGEYTCVTVIVIVMTSTSKTDQYTSTHTH